jgi:bifunctional ADP-heptose synthase (sugar kinase/adenylyltransferase)
LDILEKCKASVDVLVVGVMGDASVHLEKGGLFPIWALHERVIALAACKYVDRIDIAPTETDMIARLSGWDVVYEIGDSGDYAKEFYEVYIEIQFSRKQRMKGN